MKLTLRNIAKIWAIVALPAVVGFFLYLAWLPIFIVFGMGFGSAFMCYGIESWIKDKKL